MKRWLGAIVLALLGAVLRAEPTGEPLEPGVPAEVFLAPGRATTVVFEMAPKISSISLASPVVRYKYDRALNQLEITPAVRAAGVETNLNLRIGSNLYILLLRIVNDVRAQYYRRFTLADEAADNESGLGRAPPLKPEDVDIVGCARAMARWESDPVFRRAHPSLRVETLDRTLLWNGCPVSLSAVGQFADQDLLVFRAQWTNSTGDALYLDPRQYGIRVSGRKIPILTRYAESPGAVVYPGQTVTVHLAVQGYRLSRRNDWQLALPPDSAAVAQIMGE